MNNNLFFLQVWERAVHSASRWRADIARAEDAARGPGRGQDGPEHADGQPEGGAGVHEEEPRGGDHAYFSFHH